MGKIANFLKKKLGIKPKPFNGFKPGHLFSFEYSPKYKDTLAFYDKSPLVFFLSNDGSKRFYSLNIHFIPQKFRDKMFREFKYKKGDNMILSSSTIKGIKVLQMFFPAIIRRYLYSHIIGKVTEIPMDKDTMEEIKKFPTEQFVGLSSDEIFKISMLKRNKKAPKKKKKKGTRQ